VLNQRWEMAGYMQLCIPHTCNYFLLMSVTGECAMSWWCKSYCSQKKMVKLNTNTSMNDWSLRYLMTVFKLQWLCSIKKNAKMNMTVNKMIQNEAVKSCFEVVSLALTKGDWRMQKSRSGLSTMCWNSNLAPRRIQGQRIIVTLTSSVQTLWKPTQSEWLTFFFSI